MGATATSTAPSQGLFSMPTEDWTGRGLGAEKSQPADVHFLTWSKVNVAHSH